MRHLVDGLQPSSDWDWVYWSMWWFCYRRASPMWVIEHWRPHEGGFGLASEKKIIRWHAKEVGLPAVAGTSLVRVDEVGFEANGLQEV